jgi:hypothetical protein
VIIDLHNCAGNLQPHILPNYSHKSTNVFSFMFADMDDIPARCDQCRELCTTCLTKVKRWKRLRTKSPKTPASDDNDEDLPLNRLREDVQSLSRWKEELKGQGKIDEVKEVSGAGDMGIPDHIIHERVKNGVAQILIVWDDGMLDNASWENKYDFKQWQDYEKLFDDFAARTNSKKKARRSGFKGGRY